MENSRFSEADRLYRDALSLHARGHVDSAIDTALNALNIDSNSIDLLQYLGSTFVARKRRFGTGLAYLERALTIAPTDPNLLYTAGWCYEYVAHEIEGGRGRWDIGEAREPSTLYALSIAALRQSAILQSDQGLREDAVKLLETITGEEEI